MTGHSLTEDYRTLFEEFGAMALGTCVPWKAPLFSVRSFLRAPCGKRAISMPGGSLSKLRRRAVRLTKGQIAALGAIAAAMMEKFKAR